MNEEDSKNHTKFVNTLFKVGDAMKKVDELRSDPKNSRSGRSSSSFREIVIRK